MTEPDRIELLQNVPIFGGMKRETLAFLLEGSTRVELRQGGFLFRQGEPADEFYVLETGSVAILKRWEEQDFLLRRLEMGDCVGEMALIDYFPRSASAVAETDCRLMRIASSALMDLYERDLEQFALIQMNLARELSRRLRHAGELVFETRTRAEVSENRVHYSPI